MGHQFQDIASMAPTARNSAGQVFRYPGNRECDYKRTSFELAIAYDFFECPSFDIYLLFDQKSVFVQKVHFFRIVFFFFPEKEKYWEKNEQKKNDYNQRGSVRHLPL